MNTFEGCGPTGAMLSGYLGRMSVNHVVLEKGSDITTDPRGIAVDGDGVRLVQELGIYRQIHGEIGSCGQIFKFIGGTQKDLSRDAFLEMDYSTTEGGTGHVGIISHKQPVLEKHLRGAMASSGSCQLRSNCTVVEIQQDDDWTYCRYRCLDGKLRAIRSRFLVGADGKTGFTRKNYLEPLGIRREQAHDAFYDATWVALNWKITLPTARIHARAGIRSFFPSDFRFLCNPARPAICTRFGLPSDRLWRFEFVVLDGEDGDEITSAESTREVIFPYLTHAGKRHGLSRDVQYPEDCIRVLRSRPFRFSARSCNKWSHGRAVLCSDAAHVFPPFGGQGISSGIRDAASLAWRLALLCRQSTLDPPRHEAVLENWYLERKQQLEKSLAITIKNGEFVTESSPLKICLRSCYLFITNLVPSWRRQLRLGHRTGIGGACLPQVYCKSRAGTEFFTDDVLLVYLEGPNELASARETVFAIEGYSKGGVHIDDATYLVQDTDWSFDSADDHDSTNSVYQLASAEDFARSPLCDGRPEPQYYDMYYLGKVLGERKYVIVRPDRFMFAVRSNLEELQRTVVEAAEYLQS
ncbi:hypothetical protein BDW68DRAFT_196176 [Aspergillus falconensis]